MSSVSRVGVSVARGLSLRSLYRIAPSFNLSFPSSSLSLSCASSSSINTYRSFSSGLLHPGPNRIKQTKRDLLSLLDDECRDLTRPDDEEMKAYMEEQGLIAELDQTKNQLTLKRKVDNVEATIKFYVEPDGEDEMNQYNQDRQAGQEGQEGENDQQNNNNMIDIQNPEGQSMDEQAPKPTPHSFTVDLKIKGSNNAPNSFLRVNATADQEGKLQIDYLNTSETAAKKSDEARNAMEQLEDVDSIASLSAIDLNDLPEEASEKIFELLNDLGIDDRLALFIQQYTFEIRTKQHVEKLNMLKGFVEQIGGH